MWGSNPGRLFTIGVKCSAIELMHHLEFITSVRSTIDTSAEYLEEKAEYGEDDVDDPVEGFAHNDSLIQQTRIPTKREALVGMIC